jgi:hypothetical protein
MNNFMTSQNKGYPATKNGVGYPGLKVGLVIYYKLARGVWQARNCVPVNTFWQVNQRKLNAGLVVWQGNHHYRLARGVIQQELIGNYLPREVFNSY